MRVYVKVTGTKSGVFGGPVTIKGQEGKIECFNFEGEVEAPRDAQTGLASGKRIYKPFYFNKYIDKTSPLFYTALSSNETLKKVEFAFVGQVSSTAGQAAGAIKTQWTIELDNAQLCLVKMFSANSQGQESQISSDIQMERIGMSFNKCVWTWTDGGITATDDWLAQV